MSRFRFLIISQLTMVVFLYYQVFHPSVATAGSFDEPPPEIIVVLSRWICALFLHISMKDEADIGFKIMKYSINHPWKFNNWWSAFSVGLYQFIIIVMVEFVSMMVLLLQQSVLDVLMNFLALTVLTQFDDYLFMSLHDDPVSKLIKDEEITILGKDIKLSDIIKVETTTSWHARFKIEGNRFGRKEEDQDAHSLLAV